MNLIEQFSKGKRGEAVCEDGFILTDHFAAVIDGSTSKSVLGPLKDGKSRGQVAMETVREFIRKAAPTLDLPSFCHQATEMLREQYYHYYDADIMDYMADHPEDRFCCSSIVYSRHHDEVWLIGDCHGIIRSHDKDTYMSNSKPQEAILARKRSDYLQKTMAEGMTIDEIRHHDPGRDIIIPEMRQEMNQGQNRWYSVIDGFPIPTSNIKVYDNISDATELILASDGYPCLCPTLTETEAYLMDCLDNDPLMIYRHPATKGWMHGTDSFDDRTYLRIAL